MKIDNVKAYKMGNKLGVCLSKFYFQKGRPVQIKVIKENKEKVFLAKFNRIIVLRKDMGNSLNLKHQDLITIELDENKNLSRTSELFNKDRIDMLSLIPEKTSKGYEIIVTEFEENNEAWLRIWYSHERGSGKQLEIRRFAKIGSFGSLLGQYQAEGTKNKNSHRFRVEFTNKIIPEHQEFINSLIKLGIHKEDFVFRFTFNPNNISKQDAIDHVIQFEYIIGCKVKISEGNSKGIGFKTVLRNTILTEIVLNSLDKIRNLLANENKFKEFSAYGKFSTSFVRTSLQLERSSASDWLKNKVKEKLIVKNNYNSWSLSSEGEHLSQILKIWTEDYLNLKKLKQIENPFCLLETLKVKKLKKIKCLSEEGT